MGVEPNMCGTETRKSNDNVFKLDVMISVGEWSTGVRRGHGSEQQLWEELGISVEKYRTLAHFSYS